MSVIVSGVGLASRALRRIGKLGAGQAAVAANLADTLEQLNGFVGLLNRQDLALAAGIRTTFVLTGGVGTYTIGPTGALVGLRPPGPIDAAAVIAVGQTGESPVDVLERAAYVREAKGLVGTVSRLRYETTAGAGTLYLLDAPSDPATLVLYYKAPLAAFDESSEVTLDDGLDLMFEMNLAQIIAPIFGKQLDPTSAAYAVSSLAILKQSNEDMAELHVDPALLGGSRFDMRTGE